MWNDAALARMVSERSMARVLVVIAAMTITFNMLYVVNLPEVGIHENPFVFGDEGHMQHAAPKPKQTRDDNNHKNNHADTRNNGAIPSRSVADWMRETADLELTPELEAKLPTWSQVRDVVGTGPVILGLESCPRFREIVPPLERMMGAAGTFNTGTNLVTHLLKKNCEIPERREQSGPNQSKESYGMRWQVPWGKHTPAKFRKLHSTQKAAAIKKEFILPVVTIRHPYSWFRSMCNNKYTADWDHIRTKKDGDGKNPKCPQLKYPGNTAWNPVTVTYAENRQDHHISLAHLWNDWYSYYLDVKKRGGGDDFPFLVVRMEDLVFYPKETTTQVCECAGGKIREDQKFQLITDSAKGDSKGHDTSTGIVEAWIKYSKPNTKERYGFSEADFTNALKGLNATLMDSLGYQHPS
jgi:hypothetical protein